MHTTKIQLGAKMTDHAVWMQLQLQVYQHNRNMRYSWLYKIQEIK